MSRDAIARRSPARRPRRGAISSRGDARYTSAGRMRMTPEHREIVEQIHSSAAVLRRAVQAAPPGRITRTPSEGEWSALETLTHVRDVIVHVYGLRILSLIHISEPTR